MGLKDEPFQELRNSLDEARNLISLGKVSAAERRLSGLSIKYPNSADVWTLLATARLKMNRVDAAEQALKTAIGVEPGRSEASLLLFNTLLSLERFEDAEELIDGVVKRLPGNLDALSAKANLRFRQQRLDEAIEVSRQVLSSDKAHSPAWMTLGLALAAKEEYAGAIDAFRALADLSPEDPTAHLHLGSALLFGGLYVQAASHLERSVQLDPQNLANRLELIRLCVRTNACQKARDLANEALTLFPDSTVLKQSIKAIDDLVDATTPDPTEEAKLSMSWDELQDCGIRFQRHGRFEDSVKLLQESLRMEPNQGMGYFRLTEAKCFTLGDQPLTNQMLSVYEQDKLVPEGRIFLCFALGKAFEKAGEYERAFRFFQEGNDKFYELLRGSQKFFNAEIHRSYVESLTNFYSRDFLDSFRGCGSNKDTPIFIIGMIRSGTTLLDQIVSSHSLVKAAGEQEFWQESSIQIFSKWFNQGPDRRDLTRLADEYLYVLRTIAGDSPHITDKMPLNYEHVGLIHLAFPNARFLHIRRNPLDTCLSIYVTLFGVGPPWTYSRPDIVAFYQAYRRFMEHWRVTLPADRLLEIDYEDLVGQPEETTQQILKFLELDWEDACLRHEANPGFVKTPSRWQARQPMYVSSIGRWKRYEPWLADLLKLQNLG